MRAAGFFVSEIRLRSQARNSKRNHQAYKCKLGLLIALHYTSSNNGNILTLIWWCYWFSVSERVEYQELRKESLSDPLYSETCIKRTPSGIL